MATVSRLPFDHKNYTTQTNSTPRKFADLETCKFIFETPLVTPSCPTYPEIIPQESTSKFLEELSIRNSASMKQNTSDYKATQVDGPVFTSREENQIRRPEVDKTPDASKSSSSSEDETSQVDGSKKSERAYQLLSFEFIDKTRKEESVEITSTTMKRKDVEPEDTADVKQSGLPFKKHSQMSKTLTWLTANYERAEGVCLPRCILYSHYLDFCKKNAFSPSGAASFGKIIRQKFPKLTTRRLGTRGQSKYHYYGIGIKESSIYYHSVYTGKGLTRFSGTKVKTELRGLVGTFIPFLLAAVEWSRRAEGLGMGSNRKYSLTSKTGTLLPDFPVASNLILPESIDAEKVHIFIMMYRTHCQRILDTAVSANFEEVHSFLLHFWQGLPEHLSSLLNNDVIGDVITLCDSILYKTMADVLIPTSVQDLPDNLSNEIKAFVSHMSDWLQNALEEISVDILMRKQKVLKTFMRATKRQLSFIQLAQTLRGVLANTEITSQMAKDLDCLEPTRGNHITSLYESKREHKTFCLISEYFYGLKVMVEKQTTIEDLTEWLDTLVDTCVFQVANHEPSEIRQLAASFLLQWTSVGAWMEKELTLSTAKSFGSLHLLLTTMDEYIFLVMDTHEALSVDQSIISNAKKHLKNKDCLTGDQPLIHQSPEEKMTSMRARKRKACDEPSVKDINGKENSDFSGERQPGSDVSRGVFESCHQNKNDPASSESQKSLSSCNMTPQNPQRNGSTTEKLPTKAHQPIKHLPLAPSISPPLKPHNSSHLPYNSNFHYSDRPQQSFLPHFQVFNPCTEFPASAPQHSPRLGVSNSDHQPINGYHVVPVQSGNTFNMAATGSAPPYFCDTRNHGYIDAHESYQGCGKLGINYDKYGRNGSLLNHANPYQDSLYRSTFDPTKTFDPKMGCYPIRPQDSFSGTGFPVGSYASNLSDMQPATAQYGRQDLPHFQPQDDFYSASMATSFTRQLLSPFH